jgi:hypothetical protein
MNSKLTTLQDKNIESEMIQDILSGYRKCREFFNTYTNEGYENYTNLKKEFLADLCFSFYNKFKSYSKYLDDISSDFISSHYYVPITVNKITFLYPKSFTALIDRIKSTDVVPVSRPDLSALDQFISLSPFHNDLYLFLSNFLNHLQRINVSLRLREVDLLKLLSNPEFLHFDSNNSTWFEFPKLDALMQIFDFNNYNYKKIERAYRMLFGAGIISFTGLLNLNKLGVNYFLVNDYSSKDIDNTRKTPKFFIKCSPEKEIELGSSNVLLTNWTWNINLTSYQTKLPDPWQSFTIPHFFNSVEYPKNYIDWSMTNNNQSDDLDTYDSNLVQQHETIFNILDRSTHRIPLDRRLLTKRIQFVFPIIQHIGLDFKISLRFSSNDPNSFINVKKCLLHFPIAHVFTNESLNQGLAFFHIPRRYFSYFINSLIDLKQVDNIFFIIDYL